MSVGVMILFPGFLCLFLGMFAFIQNIFKDKPEKLGREHWLFTFALITYPIINTIQFIKTGNIE